MLPLPPHPPLPRHPDLHPLPQHRPTPRQHRHIRHPLLHHHGPTLAAPPLVARLPHHPPRHTIPPLPLTPHLLQREIPPQFQIQGVVLPDLGVFCLLRDLPRHVQRRGLRVEVDAPHPDQQRGVDSRRAGGAGRRGRGYASEGGGEEEVGGADEVVGVPLAGY